MNSVKQVSKHRYLSHAFQFLDEEILPLDEETIDEIEVTEQYMFDDEFNTTCRDMYTICDTNYSRVDSWV